MKTQLKYRTNIISYLQQQKEKKPLHTLNKFKCVIKKYLRKAKIWKKTSEQRTNEWN